MVLQLLTSVGVEPDVALKFAADLSSAPEEQFIVGGPMFSPCVTFVFAKVQEVMVGAAAELLLVEEELGATELLLATDELLALDELLDTTSLPSHGTSLYHVPILAGSTLLQTQFDQQL